MEEAQVGLENSEAEGRKNMAPWMRMWTDEIGGWGGDGSRHVSPWQSVTRGDQTDPGAVGSHRSLKVNSFNGSDSPPFPFSSSCLAPVNNIYIYIYVWQNLARVNIIIIIISLFLSIVNYNS